MDSKGKQTEGDLDAETQAEAITKLRELGLFVTKVTKGGKAKAAGTGWWR